MRSLFTNPPWTGRDAGWIGTLPEGTPCHLVGSLHDRTQDLSSEMAMTVNTVNSVGGISSHESGKSGIR